jgi:hypothetical protein
MNDDGVERLLARYRPADPDPALAEAIATAASADDPTRRPGRTWPWAVAAAALLGITIGLHAPVRSAPADPAVGNPVFAEQLDALAEQFGGSPAARALADSMLRHEAAERDVQAAGEPR